MQVSNFMEKLSKQTSSPGARTFNRQTRKIEKLSLNHPNNLGRYQVIPFCSVVTDFPFISGPVKQINLPRKNVDQSGQENQYNAWIHIPHSSFYQMKDATGRVVSSLSAEDERLLNSATTLWDELYEELDVKNKWSETKDIIRKRNYTLFTGYCLNFWRYGSADSRVPDRQNFSALFMITTKSFTTSVENNINDKAVMEGGDQSWIDRIYNNQLTNRDGFILFSINKDRDKAGFTSSVQHEFGRANMLSGVEISKEDFDAGMSDPVSLFLGWQASNQDADKPFGTRRLFNARLMKEAVDYMSNMLAAIRAAKAQNVDVTEAVTKFCEDAASSAAMDAPQDSIPSNNVGTTVNPAPTATTVTSAQIDPVSGGNPFGGFNPNPNHGFATPTSTPDFSKAAPGFDPKDMPF